MQYGKNRIQVIGNYLEPVSNALDNMGIFIENVITNCSPLAMTGTFDKAYQKYSDMPDLKNYELLNIRKNLDKVLSHDPNNFADNYNIQPISKETRRQNTSEHLVYMNSSVVLPILEKINMVYSEFTTAEIVNAIKNSDGGCTRRTFPFEGSFNWKYYYDRFINVILNEYDPEQIIFIRSNCSRFYMEGNNIKTYNNALSEQYVGLMEEIDNYFIEKTHCLVIDEQYNNIPQRYVGCNSPYLQMGMRTAAIIAGDIYDIIVNKNADAYKSHFQRYTSDFSKTLLSRLSKDIIAQNEEHLKYLDDNMLNIDKLSKLQSGTCEFFDNIIKLKQFLNIENKYRLAEYAVDVCQNKIFAADIELIELYTRYFKLDLNDIIAVYLLCNDCANAAEYKKIVSNILNNSDCVSVNSAKKFRERNIALLKEYPYTSIKEFTEDNGDVYIPLENNCWIVLNAYSEMPLKKFEFNVCRNFDFKKVIADGYACSIDSADSLTYSYDYYVEKARNGDGAKPTFLKFDTVEEFVGSLSYINYVELLENERFVFDIEGVAPSYEGYAPIADFTDFMDPNTVIVLIGAGLGDQIGYYIMGQLIKEQTGRKVLYYDHCCSFNGLEVPKLALKEMDFVNDRLSQRLNYNCDFFKDVCMRINKEYFFLTNQDSRDPKFGNVLLIRDFKLLVTTMLPYTFINAIAQVEYWLNIFDFDIHEYIGFPPLTIDGNIDIQNEMLDCDAVVIHVRRGDYVTAYLNKGLYFNYDRYIEAIKKLLEIPDYPNKKYFVFSDDIQWCKDNISSLGLDLIGNSEIRFVNSNKFDESFRDMQLMSYGKIMIGGNSGFFSFSSVYSDRCELYLGAKGSVSLCKKNKYDVGPFKEKIVIDINEKNAKENAKRSQPMPTLPKKEGITGRENSEWLNFSFDKANEKRIDRILLIGDSVSRECREPLAKLIKKPVDFFATSTNISDDKFYKTLELFFSYEEYRQCKAQIQIGVHGINGFNGFVNAIQSNSIDDFEKAYEKLVTYVLKYIPDLTIALSTSVVKPDNLSELDEKINNEIIKRNQIAKKIAEKYKLKVNDLYSLMLSEPHRDRINFPIEGREHMAKYAAKAMNILQEDT